MGRSPGRRRQIFYLQRCQQRLLRRARPAPCRKSDLGAASGRERDRPAAEYYRKLTLLSWTLKPGRSENSPRSDHTLKESVAPVSSRRWQDLLPFTTFLEVAMHDKTLPGNEIRNRIYEILY